ncbi:MAG: hypothetical protein K2J72_11710 [Oscillospiraceae bacterium]|nr:hypothetical protein [Oscillospiraceae bacterium]
MKKYFAAIIAAAALLSGCASEQPTEVTTEVTSVLGATETAVNFEAKISHEITGWTMEDLVNDIYLGGQKIVMPAHSNSLDPAFSLSGYYDSWFDETVFILSCNNEEVAFIYCDGNRSNDSDVVIDNIQYGINMPMPELNIMGITESSSSDEVKQILGEPNYIQDDGNTYRYIFSNEKQFMVSFTDDEKAIDFYLIRYEE